MIGFLKGKVIAKNAETYQCVLLTHRVGYEISISPALFDRLLIGDPASLWIHTHVREDIFNLYGFGTEAEKLFFRILLGVSGLGPKSSLALLCEHGLERLAHYIRAQDATSISSAPGIGKKLAQKIILELQSKLDKLAWIAVATKPLHNLAPVEKPSSNPMRDDLSSALLNLGFAPNQVKPTIERIFEREDTAKQGFEACLRMALKEMNTRPIEGAGRG